MTLETRPISVLTRSPDCPVCSGLSGSLNRCEVPVSETEYRFTIRPLTTEEGGGYLIEFPDLPGCMSDGETIEGALANGADAKRDWIAAMRQAGRQVPVPTVDATDTYSGKWVLRTPKSLHRSLAERARQEGVSLMRSQLPCWHRGLGSARRTTDEAHKRSRHPLHELSRSLPCAASTRSGRWLPRFTTSRSTPSVGVFLHRLDRHRHRRRNDDLELFAPACARPSRTPHRAAPSSPWWRRGRD